MLDGEALYRISPWSMFSSTREDHSRKGVGITDPLTQFFPWYRYSKQSITEGNIPLWNPYVYCGSSFLANYQSELFYPLSFPILILPVAWALWLKLMGECLIAVVGMYLLLRLYGIEWYNILPGVIVFLFSGFSVSWLQFPIFGVLCFLPLLFWSIEKAFQSQTIYHFIGMVLIWYSIVTAGNPETVTHVLVLALTFGVIRTIAELKRGVKSLFMMSSALLVSGMLASAQLIPFIEYVFDSYRLVQG